MVQLSSGDEWSSGSIVKWCRMVQWFNFRMVSNGRMVQLSYNVERSNGRMVQLSNGVKWLNGSIVVWCGMVD